MSFLTQTFNTILFQPLLNALVLIYVLLPFKDLGLAVICLTLVIKIILLPLSLRAARSQKQMAELQPKIKQLQEEYKADRAAQSKALMHLYKQEKVSPASGCLPLLIQLPIIIALYRVFLSGLNQETLQLYSFVPNPGSISQTFLGFINLENTAFVLVLALFTAIVQFWQMKLTSSRAKSKKKDFASMMQKQMLFLFPILSFFIVWRVGAVVGLYWTSTVIFSLIEQIVVNKKYGEKNKEENRKNH